MRRLNFLEDDPWDEVEDDKRVRWFGHPFGADHLGASLIEYLPQAPGGPMHMHYGVEEMFFVLGGTLIVQRQRERRLSPGSVVYFPEGRDGLHLLEPHGRACEDARHLHQAVPGCPRLPGAGVGWVATRHPERPVPEGGDEGVIARFELPPESDLAATPLRAGPHAQLVACEPVVVRACDFLRLLLGHRSRISVQIHRVDE